MNPSITLPANRSKTGARVSVAIAENRAVSALGLLGPSHQYARPREGHRVESTNTTQYAPARWTHRFVDGSTRPMDLYGYSLTSRQSMAENPDFAEKYTRARDIGRNERGRHRAPLAGPI